LGGIDPDGKITFVGGGEKLVYCDIPARLASAPALGEIAGNGLGLDPRTFVAPYPLKDDPMSANHGPLRKVAEAKVEARQDEDAALLSAIAAGDREACRALYQRYAPILLGLLDRILGDRSEAEEVLQEVFLQIWKKADHFDATRGRALYWLATIARNRALDRRSTLESRRRLTAERMPSEPPEESLDPADEANLAEEAHQLHRALAAITDAQRKVLLLAYFEGLSHSEIAERLGAPLGTVKSHARIGLAKLRDFLRARGAARGFERT
jgi:RNA polymerase sigma-70 factor (ECF subfamily)